MEPAAAGGPPPMVSASGLAPTEATRRWAALLQQIFEVDPTLIEVADRANSILAWPACRTTDKPTLLADIGK